MRIAWDWAHWRRDDVSILMPCSVDVDAWPFWPRYIVQKGVVAKQGSVVGRGMYFGDDFLLTTYFRPYVVRTLTYLDCFLLENTVIHKLFQYGQFPHVQVGKC